MVFKCTQWRLNLRLHYRVYDVHYNCTNLLHFIANMVHIMCTTSAFCSGHKVIRNVMLNSTENEISIAHTN